MFRCSQSTEDFDWIRVDEIAASSSSSHDPLDISWKSSHNGSTSLSVSNQLLVAESPEPTPKIYGSREATPPAHQVNKPVPVLDFSKEDDLSDEKEEESARTLTPEEAANVLACIRRTCGLSRSRNLNGEVATFARKGEGLGFNQDDLIQTIGFFFFAFFCVLGIFWAVELAGHL
ncbi:hypothetical protein Ddc_16341 [Ditylenchus destructor]|nr:hypothetical protein Ddc_16341 [Ditylenchus destructor]